MSLTRIGSIGINTGIAFAGVTTIVTLNTANDALSIGATVNVGSGITLGASGDIFATGVSTFSGNLKVGSGVTISPDGDGFYTGVVTATTFSGALAASNLTGALPAISGASLTGIDTDLVSDTSPQLGGDLDTNSHHILLDDSHAVKFGDSADLQIEHDGNHSYINEQGTGDLFVQTNGGSISFQKYGTSERLANFITDGAVELFYDSSKKLETKEQGVIISNQGNNRVLDVKHTDGDYAYLAFQDQNTSDNSRVRLGALNDTMIFFAGGNERLRIEPTGNLKVNQNLSVTGIATVGSAVTISESGIEASGIGITVANINGGKIGGRRNIIINGAMEVAQRGTSNTAGGDGYFTVDRMYYYNAGINNDVTKAQAAVSSGTSPYSEGFRSCFKLTNGDQSGPDASDEIIIRQNIEAWDIAQSGWNYTSSSSFITLSYWIKSSVSQNFYVNLQSVDGTAQNYVTETGTLSANTWTKVVKTIPGNSNLQFDNNYFKGMHIQWNVYRGTSVTGTRPLNAWAAYSSSTRVPDMTSTWYTTNDATFEITGVQLEVGSQATPFEFRSYGEELLLCKRYYQRSTDSSRGSSYDLATSTWHSADGSHSFSKHNNYYDWKQNFEVEMRAAPTLTIYGSSNQGDIHLESIGVGSQEVDWNNNTTEVKTKGFMLRHIEDAVYTSGSGNGFGILAYTLDAEI